MLNTPSLDCGGENLEALDLEGSLSRKNRTPVRASKFSTLYRPTKLVCVFFKSSEYSLGGRGVSPKFFSVPNSDSSQVLSGVVFEGFQKKFHK